MTTYVSSYWKMICNSCGAEVGDYPVVNHDPKNWTQIVTVGQPRGKARHYCPTCSSLIEEPFLGKKQKAS